jgi:hypothetical protein
VRFNKTSICVPHNLLQLPELAKETRISVIDLLGILSKLWVLVLFNIPDTVRKGSALGASNFLLLRRPIWKLDFVREEHTASHDVNKLELCLNCTNAFLGFFAIRHTLNNFNTEEIVSIPLKSLVTIRRNFILPFGFGDRWSDIVRMESSVSWGMVQLDSIAILDKVYRADIIPCKRSIDCVTGGIQRLSSVFQ